MAIKHLNKVQFSSTQWITIIGFIFLSLTVDRASSCPFYCECSAVTRTASCNQLSLSSVPSGLPLDLESLSLVENLINRITSSDFAEFSELTFLDLSGNDLVYLSPNSFVGNQKLRSLRLGVVVDTGNGLVTLEFIKLPESLRELSVSGNLLDMKWPLNSENKSLSGLQMLRLNMNRITSVPQDLFANLPNLTTLDLSHNRLNEFSLDWYGRADRIEVEPGDYVRELNLSFNYISTLKYNISIHRLTALQVLDISNNRLQVLDAQWFEMMPNLRTLDISGNALVSIPDGAFAFLSQLDNLQLNRLDRLLYVGENAFSGLRVLRILSLSSNPKLCSIHPNAFEDLLHNLQHLNLAFNPRLTLTNASMINNIASSPSIKSLSLAGCRWPCDCRLQTIVVAFTSLINDSRLVDDPTCSSPREIIGRPVRDVRLNAVDCLVPKIVDRGDEIVTVKRGSTAVIDCVSTGGSTVYVRWTRNGRDVATSNNISYDSYNGHINNSSSSYVSAIVLVNGSLFFSAVTLRQAGAYICIASNEYGTDVMTVAVRLDYSAVSLIALHSIIIGFVSAAAMFLFAVMIGALRYACRVCSKKERRKRKSIREVLEGIQGYKSTQLDRFSAYRTAKWDRISAIKSATVDQFTRFGHRRIDKLRTYKQATVTSILLHLERTREHYLAQTARIKDNCAGQVERLKESYGVRRGRFRNYRSNQVEKIRENYNSQVLKIRDYGLAQTARLREQYKAQQQHVLKLLELLDVGHCAAVIEAECMRTESMIFDADIAFDFESQSIRERGDDSGDDSGDDESESMSRYHTAANTPPDGSDGSLDGASSSVVLTHADIVRRYGGAQADMLRDDSVLDEVCFLEIPPVELVDPPSLTASLGFVASDLRIPMEASGENGGRNSHRFPSQSETAC